MSADRLYRSRHPQVKETAKKNTDNESYIKEI